MFKIRSVYIGLVGEKSETVLLFRDYVISCVLHSATALGPHSLSPTSSPLTETSRWYNDTK